MPIIYYTSYRRKRLLKNNQQVYRIFSILVWSWYEPCVEVGLAWSSKIGSINLIPKNVKIAETQNQTKPRILVDRHAPYEHLCHSRHETDWWVVSNVNYKFCQFWWFLKMYYGNCDDNTKFGKVSIVNGEPILSCKHLENNFYYSKFIF